MKDKKIIIIIIAMVLLCVLGVASFVLLKNIPSGTVAVISVDGEEYERIDLSRVEEPYDLEIATEFGRNTVHVEPGAISVISASCPDKVCVKQGKLTGGGVPIVCMPNRLVISIEGSGIDG